MCAPADTARLRQLAADRLGHERHLVAQSAGIRLQIAAIELNPAAGSNHGHLQAVSSRKPSHFRRLARKLPGPWPKSASWLLRNTGWARELAILDIRVIRAMTNAGVLRPNDLSADYESTEALFLQWCEQLHAAPASSICFCGSGSAARSAPGRLPLRRCETPHHRRSVRREARRASAAGWERPHVSARSGPPRGRGLARLVGRSTRG
jgi:hypothetical protein